MEVLVREASALYGAYSRGQDSPLPEPELQYADYAVWQQEWLRGEELERQKSYWRRQLANVPALELPTDRPRPPAQSYRGGVVRFEFDGELMRGLKELSRREGATLFMTFLAGFQLLLSRYSGQEDIAVGSPIANRNRAETEGIIGFFVNTLVLRTQVEGGLSFQELLGRVREVCLGAYAHQDFPFERLVEELQPERDLSRQPLFQVMLVLQNAPAGELELPGLQLVNFEIPSEAAKFDLLLSALEAEDHLVCGINYNSDLFEAATIGRMVEHLQVLFKEVIANSLTPLSDLGLLPPDERRQILFEWNRTTVISTPEYCVHQLFEAQAARSPEAVAVCFRDRQLKYRELNAQADRIARRLRGLGIGPEKVVGICAERSIETLIGVLGILKAGGAYLPLDPAYPPERLSFILQDSGVEALMTENSLATLFSQYEGAVIGLDEDWDEIAEENDVDSGVAMDWEHPAYVIYTSGSTGQPKGVVMAHRALTNLIQWQLDHTSYSSPPRTLQFSSLSFDVSFQEIFSTWCAGGVLVLIDEETHRDPVSLWKSLRENTVERLFLPFVALQQLAESADIGGASDICLRRIITAGETLKLTPPIEKLLGNLMDCILENQYGPTESHVVTTYALPQTAAQWIKKLPPIGRPIANTQIYILNGAMEAVPIGVIGDLYIGGAALARGYLNRPELTAERFVPSPYSRNPGARLYRTGDRARYLPDGNIEFLGRVDHQVKIRGFRIELGEIEIALEAHEQVREAVVTVREDAPGEKRLVAYVVGDAEQPVSPSDLRRYLRERLPEYMTPSAFVALESLPLTPSGKVDRRALPAPERAESPVGGYAPPRDALELDLVKVFEMALNVRPVGIKDNFFELGGHSLLALRVCNLIERNLGKRLPVATIFQNASVEQLAAVLRRDVNSAPRSSLVKIKSQGNRRALFFVHPVGGGVFSYLELANRLSQDRPFYAFQSRGLYDGLAPHTSIRDMATDYLAELREAQPQGPYLLGGWSMGGVVAFEMAHQLEKIEEQVELLTMVDSFNPSASIWSETIDDEAVLRDFAFDLGLSLDHLNVPIHTLSGAGTEAQLAYLLELAIRVKALPADIELIDIQRLFNVYKLNSRALQDYIPMAISAPILLLKASEGPKAQDPIEGWGKLAAAGINLRESPGDHYSIMRAPGVRVLAEQLVLYLDNVN
ncbi:MAG TPA: amino acid adenylation domain-containing protein [Blastocatellia bacterium]|nr:amino acid adenylation domain-containing protein [Blastocatellia bacterium]